MSKPFFIIGFILLVMSIQSCKKDKVDTEADDTLYNEISASGYSYYQNGNLLAGAAPSTHGSFKLRFNAIALAALDSTGKLPTGNNFPTGSIVVKEIFSGNSINLLAVMKKDPSNKNAGSSWVWAEYKTDGSVAFSADKKGNGCIGCHSGSPNRDLIRAFDLH